LDAVAEYTADIMSWHIYINNNNKIKYCVGTYDYREYTSLIEQVVSRRYRAHKCTYVYYYVKIIIISIRTAKNVAQTANHSALDSTRGRFLRRLRCTYNITVAGLQMYNNILYFYYDNIIIGTR